MKKIDVRTINPNFQIMFGNLKVNELSYVIPDSDEAVMLCSVHGRKESDMYNDAFEYLASQQLLDLKNDYVVTLE